MQAKVKEYFNILFRDQIKLKKRYRSRGRRTAGVRPMYEFNVPDITNFLHFIECEVSPTICPMLWEELEINFDDIDKRYCEYCDKYVYRADNEYVVKSLQNENKCMAVSNELLEKMNTDMDKQRYENLQNRLTVSKLFLVYKKYNPHFFKELKEKDLTYEDQLKWVIWDILKGDIKRNIEWLIERGVDVEFLFFEVVPRVEDGEFVKMVLDIIYK